MLGGTRASGGPGGPLAAQVGLRGCPLLCELYVGLVFRVNQTCSRAGKCRPWISDRCPCLRSAVSSGARKVTALPSDMNVVENTRSTSALQHLLPGGAGFVVFLRSELAN